MPFVEHAGATIYWEARGAGRPVLLIAGLGAAHDQWFRMSRPLEARYRVILFDNRGVGRSTDPPPPFSIEVMAADAVKVLDAAGVGSADVIGNSMGGMIAQEVALRYPSRVRSLLLGCTTCGRAGVPASKPVRASLTPNPSLSREEAFWVGVPNLYDVGTPRERLEEDWAMRKGVRRTVEGYMGQLQAIREWPGTIDRLAAITVRTLVLHGENDRLIPPENGRILARAIPGARLVMLEHAAHMMYADEFEAASAAVLGFLAPELEV